MDKKSGTGSIWGHIVDYATGNKGHKPDAIEKKSNRESEEDPDDFGKIGTENRRMEQSKAPVKTNEHMADLGDSHPESGSDGAPLHPKLQALAAMLKDDDDESAPKGAGFMGMRSTT